MSENNSAAIKLSGPQILSICLISLGYFVALLDLTLINVAIPKISEQLGLSLAQVFWVTNGFGLGMCPAMLVSAALASRYGSKAVFLGGLGALCVASAFGALAPSAAVLVVARVAQGVAAGLLAPQSMTLVSQLVPAEAKGRALGIWGTVSGLASIAGPAVGGLVVAAWGWRGVFWLSVSVALIALCASIRVHTPRPKPGARTDLAGLVSGTIALTALTFVFLSLAGGDGAAYALAGLAVTAVAGVAFWWGERRQRSQESLVPPALWRATGFWSYTGASLFVGLAVFCVTFLTSVTAQTHWGLSPAQAGLLLVPASLASVVLAPFAGRQLDKGRGRGVVIGGFAASMVAIVLVALTVAVSGAWWWLAPVLALFGAGNGMLVSPLSALGLHGAGPAFTNQASTLLTLARQMGAVIGGGLLGMSMAAVAPEEGIQQVGTTALISACAIPLLALVAGTILTLVAGSKRRDSAVDSL